MAELRLSPNASADLDDILAFGVENFGSAIAATYFRGFYKAFGLLEDHPLAGQVDEDVGFRRWSYRNHRIFYRVDDDTVLIVRIIHHSRDIGQVKFET